MRFPQTRTWTGDGLSPRREMVSLQDGRCTLATAIDNSHFGNYTVFMHVISRKALSDYWQKNPETEQPLKAWFSEAQKALWSSPQDIKDRYRSASFLKGNRDVVQQTFEDGIGL